MRIPTTLDSGIRAPISLRVEGLLSILIVLFTKGSGETVKDTGLADTYLDLQVIVTKANGLTILLRSAIEESISKIRVIMREQVSTIFIVLEAENLLLVHE